MTITAAVTAGCGSDSGLPSLGDDEPPAESAPGPTDAPPAPEPEPEPEPEPDPPPEPEPDPEPEPPTESQPPGEPEAPDDSEADESSNGWLLPVLIAVAIVTGLIAVAAAARSRRSSGAPTGDRDPRRTLAAVTEWVTGPGVAGLTQAVDAVAANSAHTTLVGQVARIETDAAALRATASAQLRPLLDEFLAEAARLRVCADASMRSRLTAPLDAPTVAAVDLDLRQQAERLAITMRAIGSIPG